MAPDYPANWNPVSNDAADSAWRGSPMSMFAKGGRVGCKPFEIKVPKEHTEKMARGGLAGQAKNVADAGVGGDTMVIHINKDEYHKLCKEWGEPTINPHTGMPQFTPFYKQSWFAPVAALAATALMATGVGAPIGAALLGTELGGATLAGLTGVEALGATTAGTLAGNAVLGGVAGGLTGGWSGAAKGAALSGLGTVGSSALGNYLNTPSSTGALEGASGSSTSDMAYLNAKSDQIFNPSSLSSPTSDMSYLNATSDQISGSSGNLLPSGTYDAFNASGAPSASKGIMSSITGYLTDPNKMAAAAVGLGAMSGALGGGSSAADQATAATPGTPTSTDPNMTKRLDLAPLNRTRLRPPIDYYNYGKMPEPLYYGPAQTTQDQPTIAAARGGPLSRYVEGGGTGRSDSIDAKLSDGEYVIDAETVALLGDGSSKAGAAKLDQFRANIRKQKGKALSRGKISPDAEPPERYLMGGRA